MPIPDLGLLLFVGIFGLIVGSALLVVTSPNLVHSAVALLFTLFSIAAIYVFLYADFIAATQVVVYVGGILVLIIFGVMLTNKIDNATISSPTHNRIPGIISCLILLAMVQEMILDHECVEWYGLWSAVHWSDIGTNNFNHVKRGTDR